MLGERVSAPLAQRPTDTGENGALRQWKLTRWLSKLRLETGLSAGKRVLTHELIVWCSIGGTRRRRWHPTPVLLSGKFHGRRSLIGCSPWGREESDATERLPFHFSLSWIGEGNGSPLQCSCLENPRDGRDWWAAVYGVAQSRTRLKRLSSSSSSILMSESQKRINSTKHYKVLPTSTLFITLVSFNQNLPQMAYGFHRNVFKLLIYKCVQSEYMTERSCFLRDSGIKFLKLKIPMCSRK